MVEIQKLRMKKNMLDLIVKSNEALNDQYFLLILGSENPLPPMFPGQFAELRVDNSADVFLRRPISINYVDYSNNTLWLLIQIVGSGTVKLATLKAGDSINLLLPLGNTFTIPELATTKALLVGGGVGIAPLPFLGSKKKKKGIEFDFLLGGRSAQNLLQLDDFQKYGTVYTTTEDGSHGEKGFVTNHSILTNNKYDIIYTCGPTPMMKAVAAYATKNEIVCEASLENTMACGFGACLCCVTDSVDGHVCVCTEGPVFNIDKLKW